MAIIPTLFREIVHPTVIPNKLKDIFAKRMIVHRYKKDPQNFFFIQIGSNDGVSGDPIYKYVVRYNWRGILVEPIPYLFQKLQETYSGQKSLIFENVAIHKEAGEQNFYRIGENSEPGQPEFYDKLGSFNKDFLLNQKERITNFDKHFIAEKVQAITFSDLLEKNNVKRIDLLNTDTEGYDYEIIKTIDFNKTKPKMILFESKHIIPEEMKECLELLKKNGYSVIVKGGETFAYTR